MPTIVNKAYVRDVVSPFVVTPTVTDAPIGHLVENDQSFVLATGDTTPRRLADYLQELPSGVTPELFGALNNGAHDDTAAIQAAINAAVASSAPVLLKGGAGYVVSGSGSSIFTMTSPVWIIGEGRRNTQLIVAATTPVTTDIFTFQGVSGDGALIADFKIISAGYSTQTPYGRHGVVFDQTGNDAAYFRGVVVRGMLFAGLNGYGIQNVSLITNASGGTPLAIYDNNVFVCHGGGIQVIYGGDGIHITNNTISDRFNGQSGTAVGIDWSNVSGVAGIVIRDNVIVTVNQIIVHTGTNINIIANELENHLLPSNARAAQIWIQGDLANITSTKIIGNSCVGSVGGVALEMRNIYVEAATGTVIRDNYMRTLTTAGIVTVGASTQDTQIGYNRCVHNVTDVPLIDFILDGGVRTVIDDAHGTFTATLVGGTTSPTMTVTYSVAQNLVNLSFPANFAATSNSTSCTITGLPTNLIPFSNKKALAGISDNTIAATGQILFGIDGIITLYPAIGAAANAWTAAGTKGIYQQAFTYSRN